MDPLSSPKAPVQSALASKPGLLCRFQGRLCFKPLIYGYANARVHGLYSRFLTVDQLRSLLQAPSTDAMVELLERTSYREDLVALSLHFKGDDLIELGVSRHFAAFAHELLSYSPAEARPVLGALLGRWDAHNLKVVLLARHQKKPFEQVVPFLVCAGSLDEAGLRTIYDCAKSEDVLRLLRTSPAGQMVLESINGDKRSRERLRKLILAMDQPDGLQALLDEFDRLVYVISSRSTRGLGDADSELVGRMLSRAADEKNLSTTLRLFAIQAKSADVRRYLVTGGSLPAQTWLDLIQAGPDSPAAARLGKRMGWAAILQAYNQDHSISTLEVALARLSAEQGARAFRRSQLSIGVLVGALLLKEQEMANIRKVVRGKALRLPAAEIEKMLVSAHV